MSDTAKKVLDGIGYAVDALPMLEQLTGMDIAPGKSEHVIKGVHAAISAIVRGLDGQATKEEIEERIEHLRGALYDNDAAADSALDRKFRDG